MLLEMLENTFLVVASDHKLCLKSHINYVKTKMSKSIAILHKVEYIINLNSLHELYESLVVPHVRPPTCSELWQIQNSHKSDFILKGKNK